MRIHAPLLPLAACLMAGIVVGDQLIDNWAVVLCALVPTAIVTALAHRYPRMQQTGICACTVLIGLALGARSRQLLQVEWPDARVTVDAVVVSEPVVKERVVVADVLTTQGQYKLKAHIVRDARSQRLALGDGLRLNTTINKVHAWKQGHFDYQLYMACHGLTGELYARPADWQRCQLSLDGLSVVQRARLRFLLWRHRLLSHYRQWGLADEVYGVLAAMTLGEKSQLDTQLKETFNRAGAAHILALSGLHLMMVYAVVSLLVGWRRLHGLSQVLTILAVWAFAILVGLSPSVVRAAFMISVYALLSVGHRERMSVNTLAFTAIVMLAVNAYTLYDIGFQLSFMAVLAILLLNPLFQRIVAADVLQRHRWLKACWSLTTVSLSAQLGTAPLVAYYFGRFATWFLLANYVAIPLATVVLYLSLSSLVVWWWPWLQSLLVTALTMAVTIMSRLLEVVTNLPASSIDGIRLTAVGTCLVYVLIGCAYVVSLIWLKARRNV